MVASAAADGKLWELWFTSVPRPDETERYIAYPGQACAYMIGQLRIVALREKARAAMGPKFSIREFHNVVLRSGSVPLNVLEHNVNEWIGTAS